MQRLLFTDLPTDKIWQILIQLSYQDIINVCKASNKLSIFCADDAFWREKAFRDFRFPRRHFDRPGLKPHLRFLQLSVDILDSTFGVCRAALTHDLPLVAFLIKDKGAVLANCMLRSKMRDILNNRADRLPGYIGSLVRQIVLNNALDVAARVGDLPILRYIYNNYDFTKSTALFMSIIHTMAIQQEDYDIRLLVSGIIDRMAKSAVVSSITSGNMEVYEYLVEKYNDISRIHGDVSSGILINDIGDMAEAAAKNKDVRMIEELLNIRRLGIINTTFDEEGDFLMIVVYRTFLIDPNLAIHIINKYFDPNRLFVDYLNSPIETDYKFVVWLAKTYRLGRNTLNEAFINIAGYLNNEQIDLLVGLGANAYNEAIQKAMDLIVVPEGTIEHLKALRDSK